jgi:hypothetical protein
MNINSIQKYGTFQSYKQQIIKDDENIHYDTINYTPDTFEIIDSNSIKFLNSGCYHINFSMILDSVGQIAIYINNNILQYTITSSDEFYDIDNSNMILFNNRIVVKENDILTIKNFNTFDSIITKKIENIINTDINLDLWNVKLLLLFIN